MRSFFEWTAFADYLAGLGLFRMEPGLERIREVLEQAGLRRPPFTVIQVVGTNGKGSTSVFLAALAAAHGLRAGLHTSPHFVSFRERIRIFAAHSHSGGGGLAPESDWLRAANAIMQAGGERLTYFELLTAIAVALFAQSGVQVAVMESGLGGLFDATTALAADYLVYTPIALDHADVLGGTLEAVARDKAGAMRVGRPVFSAPQEKRVEDILRQTAFAKGAVLRFAAPTADEIKADPLPPLRLAGAYQIMNATLARTSWRAIAQDMADAPRRGAAAGPVSAPDRKAEAAAFAAAWLPGRLQQIPAGPNHPPMLLDGGHNAHGLAALGESLARAGISPGAVIFACLKDKEPEKLTPHLRALAGGPIFVPGIAGNPRAMDPEALARLIGPSAQSVPSLAAALEAAGACLRERLGAYASIPDKNPLLICGSLYLLGDFFSIFPKYLKL